MRALSTDKNSNMRLPIIALYKHNNEDLRTAKILPHRWLRLSQGWIKGEKNVKRIFLQENFFMDQFHSVPDSCLVVIAKSIKIHRDVLHFCCRNGTVSYAWLVSTTPTRHALIGRQHKWVRQTDFKIASTLSVTSVRNVPCRCSRH